MLLLMQSEKAQCYVAAAEVHAKEGEAQEVKKMKQF